MTAASPPPTVSDAAPRAARLARLLGAGTLVLMAVTWKLWIPQDVFPRVPLFHWAPPRWLDWVSLAVIATGIVGLLFHRRVIERRTAAACLACGFASQFLADQHRLQPWAWQFLIVALVIALADDRTVVIGWRWLVISIYAYSALSKFDAAFQHGLGATLLEPIERLLGWGPNAPPPGGWQPVRTFVLLDATTLFPLGELTVAGLLLCSRTRRWGLYGSWLMHGSLLWLLGPFGLNHSLGVLLWNAFFVVQNWYLFAGSPQESTRDMSVPRRVMSVGHYVAWGVLWFAYLLPAGYPLGFCDAWLGWAVYAPPFELVTIRVDPGCYDTLPAAARDVAGPGGLFDLHQFWVGGVPVDPGDWSLKALGVPSYPASRFRAAVALALIEEHACESVKVVVLQRQGRNAVMLSELGAKTYATRDELWSYAGTFWFNAYPEAAYRPSQPGARATGE